MSRLGRERHAAVCASEAAPPSTEGTPTKAPGRATGALPAGATEFDRPPAPQPTALTELRRILQLRKQIVVLRNPLNPLTVHAVKTYPFDENAIPIPARRMRERLAEAVLRELKRDFCVFFPAFLARLRPLERRLGWLPLGAQYLIRGRR